MDEYDYQGEYDNFDTQDFDTLGDTAGWGGESSGGYDAWQTPQTNNNGGYDFQGEMNNWDTGNWDDLGNTSQWQPDYNQNWQLDNGPNPGQGYGGFAGNPNQSGGSGGFDWSKLGTNLAGGAGNLLNDLFAPRQGGQAGGMDILKGLSPFLAALYNKKTAPAQQAATDRYIQAQQQALRPFDNMGGRQEAYNQWAGSNARLEQLRNNRNLTPEALAQDALSKYTIGRTDARNSNRFNNGRTQLMAGLANQNNLIERELKANDMYGRQAGASFNPQGLEGLLKSGLGAAQNAANPYMGLFAALGQMNNQQSPQANPQGFSQDQLAQLAKLMGKA